MMSDLNCPYCNHDIDVWDIDGYSKCDTPHEIQCPACENNFVFYTHIYFKYEAQKADCLNKGQHHWHPTITVPAEYTKMICRHCGDSRPCTGEEISDILLKRNNIQS